MSIPLASLRAVASEDILPKFFLNSRHVKSRSSIKSISFVESLWNFAQRTAVSLPFSVQNFECDNREISYGRARFRAIWVQVEFRMDATPPSWLIGVVSLDMSCVADTAAWSLMWINVRHLFEKLKLFSNNHTGMQHRNSWTPKRSHRSF